MLIKIEFLDNSYYFERLQYRRFYYHIKLYPIYYEVAQLFNNDLYTVFIDKNKVALYDEFNDINKLNLKYY
jgi:hypothetical protein